MQPTPVARFPTLVAMSGLRPLCTHRSSRWVGVVGIVVAFVVTGCDTGDGRQLADPVYGLPATTTSTTSIPAETFPAEAIPAETFSAESSLAPPDAGIVLTAPWQDGAPIPQRHTCDGDDVSPALAWNGVPAEATELAVTVTDLDASDFVHWAVTGIAPSSTGIFEGEVPESATVWPNSFGDAAWGGPCPPDGESHVYQFTLHALDRPLASVAGDDGSDLLAALDLVALEQSSVSGSYARGE